MTAPAAPPESPSGIDRRRFLLGAIGGVSALALGSCRRGSGRPSGPGTERTVRLQWGALGFPSPFACVADIGYNQMSLLYDTLLWKDGTGQLLPWLARSVSASADRLSYRFELREGARWSDGRPVTADDVVFTFEYYARQKALPPPVIIQPPGGIAKVTATDSATVEITLERPLVTFPEMVAAAVPIVPRHVWQSVDDPGGAQDRKLLVGSGAYRLDSYSGDGSPERFVAKDNYMLGRPFIRRIDHNAVDDPFPALLTGGVDAAWGAGLRDDTLAPFRADHRFGMVAAVGSSTFVLYWNLGKEGPLADVRFRRACAMAVDRPDLVRRLSAGKGLPGNPGFLSPDNPYFAPVPQYDVDPAAANALLDAAGYQHGTGAIRRTPDGGALSLELLADTAQSPLTEVLVAALRGVGIELRPKPVQLGPQLFGNKLLGAYDMAVLPFPGPGPGGPNADPDVLRLLFSSRVGPSLQAATAFANPTFDDLADRQRETFDDGERKAIVARMQQIVAEDLPVLALYYPETTIVFDSRVLHDWYFTPGQFPSSQDNKQLFITGLKEGTTIRAPR